MLPDMPIVAFCPVSSAQGTQLIEQGEHLVG